MAAQQLAVQFDTLTLDGTPTLSAGESERYRITFPPSATSTDSNSGDNIQQATPFRSAVLTVSCYQTDATHQVLLAYYAAQQAGLGSPSQRPGAAGLSSLPGASVMWSHAYITQQAEIVSSREAQVVVWTLTLVDVVRQGM